MDRFSKIIEYGLYLLVFLLPWQARWIISQGTMDGWPYEFSTISLYATDVLLLFLLVLFAFRQFYFLKEQKTTSAKVTLAWWFIGLIELAAFISIWLAPNKAVAVQAYLRLLLGIGLFWIASGQTYDWKKIRDIFIVSSGLQAILGIVQFFTQKVFASAFFGMAVHISSDIGAAVITTSDGTRWLRAYGSLDHPNIFGGLMAMALLILIIELSKRNNHSEDEKSASRLQIIYYFLLIILTCGLFFSFSRAAWLGFLGGLIVLGFFSVRKKEIMNFGKIFIIIATAIIVLMIPYHNLVTARVTDSTATEKKSINERTNVYKIFWQAEKNNLVFGSGIGNYGLAIKNTFPDKEYYYFQPIHNVFLLVWGEVGIVGLVGFIGLLITLWWRALKVGDMQGIAILICVFILFIFDHWLWSLHAGILIFWLLLGVIYGHEKANN